MCRERLHKPFKALGTRLRRCRAARSSGGQAGMAAPSVEMQASFQRRGQAC